MGTASFPKTVIADWDAIKADFTAGIPAIELEQRYHVASPTIRARARRERWLPINANVKPPKASLFKGLTDAAVTAVTEAMNAAVTLTLREQQDAWKAKELRVATKLVDTANAKIDESLPPRDLASLTTTIDGGSRIARRALDLDTEQQLTAFSAGLCTGSRLQRGAEKEAQVIDVSTNPPVEPQA